MSTAVGSIPPPLASGFPPAFAGRGAPPSLPRSGLRRAPFLSPPTALQPLPAPEVVLEPISEPAPAPAPAVAEAAAPHVEAALTAVIFRPNGGGALTVRITKARCIGAALLVACTASAALAFGWVLGEWTARLPW